MSGIYLICKYLIIDVPSSPTRRTSLRDDDMIPGSLHKEPYQEHGRTHSNLIVSIKGAHMLFLHNREQIERLSVSFPQVLSCVLESNIYSPLYPGHP